MDEEESRDQENRRILQKALKNIENEQCTHVEMSSNPLSRKHLKFRFLRK